MTTILFIDDSVTTTMSPKSALDMAGFTVTACYDGPTALGHIDRGYKPDMVITDINMPGMNGLELIQHVRGRMRFTPIVALSADKQAAARELGASSWLVTSSAQYASSSGAAFSDKTRPDPSPTLRRSS